MEKVDLINKLAPLQFVTVATLLTETAPSLFSPSGALWQGEGDAGERDEGEGNKDNNDDMMK